jgi:hypothetical protein
MVIFLRKCNLKYKAEEGRAWKMCKKKLTKHGGKGKKFKVCESNKVGGGLSVMLMVD